LITFLNVNIENGKGVPCVTTQKQNDINRTVRNAAQKQLRTKDRNLRKRYGITLEDYNRMLEEQDYKCAICGKHNDDERYGLCVEHTHLTGYVRGLVCNWCNRRIIGRSAEDYYIVKSLITYLQKAIKGDTNWEKKTIARRKLNAARRAKKKKS